MQRRKTIVASLLMLGLLLVTIGAAGAQPPPIPSDYSGTVTIGGRPAPDGAAVQGQIDTYTSAPVTVTGGKYTFLIVGPLTPSALGKTVTFLVNGVTANETSTFEMGTTKTLNLTVATAPAQPAPAPTSLGIPLAPSADSTPPATLPATSNPEDNTTTWVVLIVTVVAVFGFVVWRRIRR